jgi:hypothetical protein
MRGLKRRMIAGIGVALLAGLALVVWPAGLARYRSWELGRAVDRGPGSVVHFAEIGPGGWDRVYVFHPYYLPEKVQEDLEFPWPRAADSTIEWNDGVNLVVFVRGGAVAGWFEHPRNRGDLTGLSNRVGYARSEARFVVQTDQEGRAILVVRGAAAEPVGAPDRGGGQ